MATRRPSRASASPRASAPTAARTAPLSANDVGTTGRYLVLLRGGANTATATRTLRQALGLKVAVTSDASDGKSADLLGQGDGIFFEHIGVALVSATPDQVRAAEAAENATLAAVEAERVVYAVHRFSPQYLPAVERDTDEICAAYVRGYRDAVSHLAGRMLGEPDDYLAEEWERLSDGEREVTWGLAATRVDASRYSGKGSRVAVLDTGIDLTHPDFSSRTVHAESFIANEPAQDGHGHGTHCIGTACGPRQAARGPRYGVAFDAEIFAGKVLDNRGRGTDGSILAGIDWAVRNRCRIVSLSLGAPVDPGATYSQVFEAVADRALALGTLLVAAAGNESARPHSIRPVGHPANCPSIMAVGALDRRLRVAPFSSAGLEPNGGQVDIAAPGVAVLSAWPLPVQYRSLNGTSMATPHVAGIAALIAQSDRRARGRELQSRLLQAARRLGEPARDVGNGLVLAP